MVPTQKPTKPASEPLIVLVVDDRYDNRYLLETTLKSKGYIVKTAGNGQEALDYLKKNPVHLIITDILMPKMDGFQLCREVHMDPQLKNIPLVFYTASYTSDKDRAFGLALGAERYILKPADTDVFLAEIGEVLAKAPLITPGEPASTPASSSTSSPAPAPETNEEYLTEYSQRIFNKLQSKIRQLETKNQEYEVSQQSLRESEQKFRTLFDTANDAIFLHEMEPEGQPGRILMANKAASKMLGYTNEEFLNLVVTDLNDPEYETPLSSLYEVLEKEPEKPFEWAHRTKDGRSLPVEISVKRFASGDKMFAVSIVRDISGRKKVENTLKEALAERDVLLREIHNRVNNNLQVILSMIALEEISYHDELARTPVALKMCSDMENRIRAIAMVHEHLQHSGELTGILLHDHLSLLAQEILTSEIGRVFITYSVEGGEGVVVPMDKAVLLSLAVNEILTNSLEYAFPDNEQGTVTILIYEEPGSLCLDISDDGVGLPAGMVLRFEESVGLSIIYNVVTVQLGGTVELLEGKGTTYHICIPGTI